jgi:hypothetical protein
VPKRAGLIILVIAVLLAWLGYRQHSSAYERPAGAPADVGSLERLK